MLGIVGLAVAAASYLVNVRTELESKRGEREGNIGKGLWSLVVVKEEEEAFDFSTPPAL